MTLKEMLYLLGYSIKHLLNDLVDFLLEFKKAKTWGFIFYFTLVYAYFTNNIVLYWTALPIIGLIYVVRQHKEPRYHLELKKKALLTNNESEVRKYYESYKKNCFFSNKNPMSYEAFKESELKKLQEKTNTESGHSHNL